MSSDILPSASGIYRITCTVTSNFYIGSAIDLQKRRREHLHALRHNKHTNSRLQRAFNKHGEQAFTFDVLELVLLPEMLTAREQYWFEKLKPFGKKGYNLDPVAGSRYGSTHSPETREKLRLANLGKKQSEETRQKRSEQGKGRTHSDATREKVRLIRLGTKRSDETRQRLRDSHLGKKPSDETRKKMSQARLGRAVSDETRAQISQSNIESNAWRMKTLIVTSPLGETFTIHGIGQFCKEHGLNHSALIQVAKGRVSQHKGWKARYP